MGLRNWRKRWSNFARSCVSRLRRSLNKVDTLGLKNGQILRLLLRIGSSRESLYGSILLYICGALNAVLRKLRDMVQRQGAGESIFH
jgi:hypothetical protein